jgi:PEP-CTERM motif-containing protein
MGKFRRDLGVARNIKRGNYQKSCRFHGGHYLSIICAAVTLAVAYSPGAHAQATPTGPGVSLASLTNSGAFIVSGDKDFTGFSAINSLTIADNLITVTPIIAAGNFGIEISGPMSAGAGGADLVLTYEVSVTNSPNLISAANLAFNGVTVAGTGTTEVVENVYTNNSLTPYGTMTVYYINAGSSTSSQMFASLPITPPQPLLFINKDVQLTAVFPAYSSISEIYQTYTQVPEPSTFALAAAGLSGLFLLRRRKR